MNAIKSMLIALVIVAVFAGLLFYRQGSRNPLCQPAVFLGFSGNQPEQIVSGMIDDLGGLPQADADLADIKDPRIVVPVAEWRVRSAVVQNDDANFIKTIRDDAPVMRYTIDLDVDWEDGASGVVQWESWRQGFVSCPLAVSKGAGPMGAVRIVALTPAPPEPLETPEATPED